MEYTYLCEKYNPYGNHNLSLIVDERQLISSPAYLYTFVDELTNDKYCVISDNVGIQMPFMKVQSEFVVGTSHYVYFFDIISKRVVYKSLLHSPCMMVLTLHNKMIVICESDVVIISLKDKRIIAKFEFNDIIVNYEIHKNSLFLQLMEGTEQKIDI